MNDNSQLLIGNYENRSALVVDQMLLLWLISALL